MTALYYLLSKVAFCYVTKKVTKVIGVVFMYAYNWAYDFDPVFPVHVFKFLVEGNRDKMHWHEYFEIGLCIDGKGKFIYINKEYPVEEGDVFCTNNFENHVAITEEGQYSEYIFLIFQPSLIADPNGRQVYLEYLMPFQYNPLEFQNKINKGQHASKELHSLIWKAYDIYTKRDKFYKLELDICLRQILLEISEHYFLATDERFSNQNIMNKKIQMAVQYMNTHFGDKLTIKKMAEYLGTSPSYFRHLFKNNTQISFKTYITRLRMSQAKKLLLATSKNVDEIIAEVGYSNCNQFYKTFKNFMSMTPAEYRKQYRNISESSSDMDSTSQNE